MKAKRIYISGKISGEDYEEVRMRFKEVQEMLEEQCHYVFNPVEFCEKMVGREGSLRWEEYMLLLLPELTKRDTIYMLDNWGDSYGSRIEYLWAVRCGLNIVKESSVDIHEEFNEPNYFRKMYYQTYREVDCLNRKLRRLKIELILACALSVLSGGFLIGHMVKHLIQ